MAYRRLMFLDQTLQSMIQRFEEEYPDSRIAPNGTTLVEPSASMASSFQSTLTSSFATGERAELLNPSGDVDDGEDDTVKPPMSRHNSDASLASRALTLEEGRLHRLGQSIRREIVDSIPTTHTPLGDGVAPPPTAGQQRLEILKERLESTPGNELGPLVEKIGWKAVLDKVGANLDDLRQLQELDPEGWEQFRDSHMKARMNV
jgi:hypothetical protein